MRLKWLPGNYCCITWILAALSVRHLSNDGSLMKSVTMQSFSTFWALNSPDQPLYTNHLRAGRKTRLSPPLEDTNRPFPPGALCSSELPLWPLGSLQDSWALVLQTNPVTHTHTHRECHDIFIKILCNFYLHYVIEQWCSSVITEHTESKYKPRFSRIGSSSSELWHWTQLQQETMLWHFSEHESTSFCASQSKATFYTQTFWLKSAVCPVGAYWSL